MIISLYVRAMVYGASCSTEIWTRPLLLKRVTKNHVKQEKLKTVDERSSRREKCWAVLMERRTTMKAGNLGNSIFVPKMTEICCKMYQMYRKT